MSDLQALRRRIAELERSLAALERDNEALRRDETRYRTILASIEDGYFESDLQGNNTFLNPALSRIFGYGEHELIGVNYSHIVGQEMAPEVFQKFNLVYRSGKPSTFDFRIRRPDGGSREIEAAVSLMVDPSGKKTGFRAIVRDVTERKEAEARLQESEARLRRITDNMLDMVTQTDVMGVFQYVSPSHKGILGYEPEEMLGKSIYHFLHPEDADAMRAAVRTAIKTSTPGRLEFRYRHADGRYIWLEAMGNLLFGDDGRAVGAIFGARDITERRRQEEQLDHMATHDPLTDLPNRTLLKDRFELALAHARRKGSRLAVMMLDLDRFKDVNDRLGHNVGDEVLKDVGERLRALLRRGDTIARLGGDEFMILLPEFREDADAANVARKILEACAQPLMA